ncbi:hypothetical protein PCASD_08268 [Puccinia coronata f. sp. avenae]|uniref:Uncharacterized protein n=1 Tax=Puccinia coronata f. sp. avenae TaxID=200324 RepID=A0A2N5V108_9BASI|nr:hypothetical protein PCASD_08268 [Puccinia coronata f. sp. avenae]
MTYGTAEERQLAKKNMAWQERNAITATPLQKIVASLRKVFLKHAHGSSEGLTFVNLYNTLEFLSISHIHHMVWANVILISKPGVNFTHPPTSPNFTWEPVTIQSVNLPPTTKEPAVISRGYELLKESPGTQPSSVGSSAFFGGADQSHYGALNARMMPQSKEKYQRISCSLSYPNQ